MCQFDSDRGHVNGQYTEDSDGEDFCWKIKEELANNHEACISIGGYKYPSKDVHDQKALSHHDLHVDLSIGERWVHYTNIDFGCTHAAPEDVLSDLDVVIDMMSKTRAKFAQLMMDFPSESWVPEN